MAGVISAPKLPIQNRSTISPRPTKSCEPLLPRSASPVGHRRSPIGPGRRQDRRKALAAWESAASANTGNTGNTGSWAAGQARWADYTPTWHEAHSPWPEGQLQSAKSCEVRSPKFERRELRGRSLQLHVPSNTARLESRAEI